MGKTDADGSLTRLAVARVVELSHGGGWVGDSVRCWLVLVLVVLAVLAQVQVLLRLLLLLLEGCAAGDVAGPALGGVPLLRRGPRSVGRTRRSESRRGTASGKHAPSPCGCYGARDPAGGAL